MSNSLKILSLFDGISATNQALKNIGIENYDYYASEIDPYAIKVTQNNFPNTVQLGDVKSIFFDNYDDDVGVVINKKESRVEQQGIFNVIKHYNYEWLAVEGVVDLLSFGFPCQDLSIAKKDRKGLDGERSGLFYEALRILKEVKPKYFFAENVNSMSKEMKDIISKELFDIQPIMINSALVTAQQRKRLFWVGALQTDGTYKKIEIEQPQDKGILLKDILESGLPYQEKAHSLTASYSGAVFWNSIEKSQKSMVAEPVKSKYFTITKEYEKRINDIDVSFNQYLKDCKKLTITEIAEYCNEPKTKIEHYFRVDKSRAIPSKKTYYKLKEFLQLDSRFDNLIEEVETLTATFEQNLRIYDINYKAPTLTSSKVEILAPVRIGHFNKGGQGDRIYSVQGKSVCLSANGGGRGAKTGLYKVDLPDGDYTTRKLTPNECARLQGFPDNYHDGISNTQAYKCYGNSFTVPVIEHILKTILK
jgi:DNA-cytosine methyltransferase